MIVECYLEAKYYHYDPEDIYELIDFNVNAENLVESDDIVTVQNIEQRMVVICMSIRRPHGERESSRS